MKKIPSLFVRNYDGDRLVRDEVVPGSEWVCKGEGVATYKWDGTSCMVRSGRLFRRYELKPGKTAPEGFEPAQDPDPVTGKQPGWVPVGDGPEDRWHREALSYEPAPPPDGTYELCGPKVQGNPHRLVRHHLIPHGAHPIDQAPRRFLSLREFFADTDMAYLEGIVWHHPDGRMVKIKAKDFGVKR